MGTPPYLFRQPGAPRSRGVGTALRPLLAQRLQKMIVEYDDDYLKTRGTTVKVKSTAWKCMCVKVEVKSTASRDSELPFLSRVFKEIGDYLT